MKERGYFMINEKNEIIEKFIKEYDEATSYRGKKEVMDKIKNHLCKEYNITKDIFNFVWDRAYNVNNEVLVLRQSKNEYVVDTIETTLRRFYDFLDFGLNFNKLMFKSKCAPFEFNKKDEILVRKDYKIENAYMDGKEYTLCEMLDIDDSKPVIDIMAQVAEENTTHDINILKDKAFKAKEDIDSITRGGLYVKSPKDDSTAIVSAAICYHYKVVIYNNLDAIAYNILLDYFKRKYGGLPCAHDKKISKSIDAFISSLTYKFDNELTWGDIKMALNKYVRNGFID